GRTGRLSFDNVAVADGSLSLGFLPCAFCFLEPGVVLDGNAIIDAIEVLPAGSTIRTCPRDLICEVAGNGSVTGTWTGPQNVTLSGYEVFRGSEMIATLPAGATSFTDANPPCERRVEYRVTALSNDPQFLCPGLTMSCGINQPECPFGAPLRINMGGTDVVDSNGNRWLGDGPGGGDPLEIRVDDASGSNWIEGWCAPDATTVDALGFDGTHPADRYLLSTIRWDVGNDGIDFHLEIPIVDGDYTVNLYFNECCCANRHFKVEIQGEILDEDVSYLDYDTAAPALGKVGRLSFEGIEVGDGILRIGFLPCPECPGAGDTNAIINAIEVLPPGSGGVQFHRGDADDNGSLQLTDAVRILGFLFLGGPAPTCLEAADADDNGSLQLTDAVRILGFLFLGGPPPAPPGPPPSPCGPDPAGSPDLGCDSYTSC
ncbi:MAG TPA: hypothetical protein VMT52_14645, partial [Planctomycetota bacterium]|nr:hypothetical protein [Planctomycetota bacterium]